MQRPENDLSWFIPPKVVLWPPEWGHGKAVRYVSWK